MNARSANQINLIEALPAIYTINQPTQREIDSLVSWVKREGKVSYFDASVVLESAVIAAAVKAGLLVEANNYLTLPVVEVAAAPEVAVVAEVAPRPTWLSLQERYAITNELIKFVIAEVPSLEKLGKKEIAALNSLMPAELKNDVTILGLTRSVRGATWGKPRNYLLIKFVYFTGMKDDRSIDLTELEEAAKASQVQAAEVPAVQLNAQESTEQCAKSDIDQQIADLKATGDSAYIQAANLYQDCLQGDWLDRLVVEIEAEQQNEQEDTNLDTLELPGMKCKNLDRDDDYWFFVGERFSAFAAVAWLADLGVYTSAKPNGSTGCYKVLVPRWVRGSLLPAVQSQAA